MFKKGKYLMTIILIVLVVASVWVLEPFSLNVMKGLPKTPIISAFESEESTIDSLIKSKIDSVFLNALNMDDWCGVSAGLYTEDKLTWLGSSGYKTKGGLELSDNKTKYRIASISKPFTAIAIMQLVEEGKVALDSSIAYYIPKYSNTQFEKIKVRHLLNHTAGVRHYHSDLEAVSFKQYASQLDALTKFDNDPLFV